MSKYRNIEQRLSCYPALEEIEKEELERYVGDHPEWLGLLHGARHWGEFLSSAKSLNDPDADEKTIAYAAMTDRLPNSVVPEALVSPLARLKRRIDADPMRQKRYDLYSSRLDELESESDVVSHFEAITGHTFSREFIPASSAEKSRVPTRPDPHPHPRRARIRRGILRGSAMLLVLYLVLFSFSYLGESRSGRLAHIRTDDLRWTELGISTRGNDPAWERELTLRYDAALNEAARAKSSVLGLFTSYDYERIGRARTLLEGTIGIQERLENAPASAYLLLAKLSWLMHDSLATRSALSSALSNGGAAAVRAREFLDNL